MKPKMKVKMLIDLLMSVLMLLLMSYALIGEALHEWLGASMLAAFLCHHGLNAAWHKNLNKGKYSPMRIAMLVVNILILICMVGLAVSGVILSGHVFAALPIRGGMGFARIAHMLCSYWGFVLMAIHLGMHWNILSGVFRRMGAGKPSKVAAQSGKIAELLLAAYGLYAFIKNDLLSYMFLQTKFVFIDYSQPIWDFVMEYIAIAALFVWLTYKAISLLNKQRTKRKAISGDNSAI